MSTLIGPVVKVGGSLLELGNLSSRLACWSAQQKTRPCVYIAGGGVWIDAIRRADQRFALGPEAAHWLSVAAMRVTAELLARLLPDASVTTAIDQVPMFTKHPIVLIVEEFLRSAEPLVRGTPLPHSWEVTSDSIAARVAVALESPELVLLKSTLPDPDTSLTKAAELGYVDAFFPIAAREVPRIRCVNLRQDGAREIVWKMSIG